MVKSLFKREEALVIILVVIIIIAIPFAVMFLRGFEADGNEASVSIQSADLHVENVEIGEEDNIYGDIVLNLSVYNTGVWDLKWSGAVFDFSGGKWVLYDPKPKDFPWNSRHTLPEFPKLPIEIDGYPTSLTSRVRVNLTGLTGESYSGILTVYCESSERGLVSDNINISLYIPEEGSE